MDADDGERRAAAALLLLLHLLLILLLLLLRLLSPLPFHAGGGRHAAAQPAGSAMAPVVPAGSFPLLHPTCGLLDASSPQGACAPPVSETPGKKVFLIKTICWPAAFQIHV